jgi:DNA-binding transcriptional LysR family regulator
VRLSQIRHFISVVENGSIGRAAKELGHSQPGITKSIKMLEAELQVPLLRRTTRGAVPTAYGKALYSRAHVAQSELRRAEQEIRALSGEKGGSVAMGFGPVAAALIIPAAVGVFRRQFPQVSLRLLEGLAHINLPLVLDETLDFAIAPGLPAYRRDSRLRFRSVFHFERVVVGRRDHPLAKSQSIRRLMDATWLTIEPQGMLEQAFATMGISSPQPVVQADSGTAALWLLHGSDMLAVIPRPLLGTTNAVLQEIMLEERFPPFTAGIYTRSDSPPGRAAAALAKIVLAEGKDVARRSRKGRL